ncbi:PucR family transcriptional regulator [Streptomyces sp. NRRL S-337]|uniref:PucR family transcriptional regulator n=1 Tax=Streptomyces sp. NRRL S-337 TaxID=1463900 RepID=UPI001F4159E6|nr:helix-turn-helix domain-containing protein [Streptomyces sp. NRRL S-337]
METSTRVPGAVAALHAAIDALTNEVIHALRAQLPSYAVLSADQLRPRVTVSLRNGLALVQHWSGQGHHSAKGTVHGSGPAYNLPAYDVPACDLPTYDLPAGHLTEVTALARRVPVEDIISAYRIGSDIVWRRFGEEMAARQGTAEDLLPIAETLRAWAAATTLRIVRSCRADLQRRTVTDRRRAALVRALLLGEARWADTGADGRRREGELNGELEGELDGVFDRSALHLAFRARLPAPSGPDGPACSPAPTPAQHGPGHPDSADGALARTVDLLRPWLARDASGRPLVTTVDGEVAGLLAVRPEGLCRNLVVGLGAPAPASGLAQEFVRATQALRAAVGSGLVGVFTHEELGLRATVVALPDVGEQLVRLRLAPLAERGEDGAQLEEAVAAYLRQGMRLEAAARALYVHPNTLRNRLRRFEEITGTSLRDPADLAEVWWALTHRRIHGPAS